MFIKEYFKLYLQMYVVICVDAFFAHNLCTIVMDN